jgi:tRNA dimethylallyltransferase
MSMSKQKAIAVVGPTASGKSALAITLAKEIHGEVISADSRQVYEGFDTTTAKVTPKEMLGIPHHLLDIAPIEREYTVADFVHDGKAAITSIAAKGAIPIIAGGTGFYIDALLFGQSLPQVPPNQVLRASLTTMTTDTLFAMLQAKDPHRAATIEQQNKQRLIRALEIVDTLGVVPPQATMSDAPYDTLWIGILWQRDELIQRIHERVLHRVDNMITEISNEKNRLTPQIASRLGFDFTLTLSYVEGAMTKDALIDALTQKDAAYARRQMTWFKRNKQITWLSPETLPSSAIDLARRFLA